MGLAYSVVHYHHGRKNGGAQVDMVVAENSKFRSAGSRKRDTGPDLGF